MKILLTNYQNRVIDRLFKDDRKGLIVYHSMGSGKTLTALKSCEFAKKKFGGKSLIVTPASLVENIYKELKKHNLKLSENDVVVISYEKAANKISQLLTYNWNLVVFDEAHRLRNPDGKRASELSKLVDNNKKILMLTGTAGYNSPVDIIQLIKILDKNINVPTTLKEFEEKYIDFKTGKLRPDKNLLFVINKYCDVYDKPVDGPDFPRVKEKIIKVPMSEDQYELYTFLEKDLPKHIKSAIRDNMPLSLQESNHLNMYSTGIRQASDSTLHHNINGIPEESSKIVSAVNSMIRSCREPRFRGVVYSNFIDAGIIPYAKLLEKKGVKPLIFTGKTSVQDKIRIIKKYNSNSEDPIVLLISSSGGEGLDLIGTNKIQILEPHFNKSKIDQVKGRGIRYKSHNHLPKNKRIIEIEEYHATRPLNWLNKIGFKPKVAIDEYLSDLSNRKQGIINQIKGLSNNNFSKY